MPYQNHAIVTHIVQIGVTCFDEHIHVAVGHNSHTLPEDVANASVRSVVVRHAAHGRLTEILALRQGHGTGCHQLLPSTLLVLELIVCIYKNERKKTNQN